MSFLLLLAEIQLGRAEIGVHFCRIPANMSFCFHFFFRYVTNPDFDPNNIRSVSSACEGLCRWVRAMEVYERVAKVRLYYVSLKPL